MYYMPYVFIIKIEDIKIILICFYITVNGYMQTAEMQKINMNQQLQQGSKFNL